MSLHVTVNSNCVLLLLLERLLLNLHANCLDDAAQQIVGLVAALSGSANHVKTLASVIDGIFDKHFVIGLQCAMIEPIAEYCQRVFRNISHLVHLFHLVGTLGTDYLGQSVLLINLWSYNVSRYFGLYLD